MQTALLRLNAIAFFALSVLFTLAFGSWITTLWHEPTFDIKTLKVKSLHALARQRMSRTSNEVSDRALISFDMDADLKGVFDWNVKQLYVYVTAQYMVPSTGAYHEIVIWDDIVTSPDKAHLVVQDSIIEYPISDYGTNLESSSVTLTLNWDVMPLTGFLYKSYNPKSTFRMPPSVCTEDCIATRVAFKDVPKPVDSVAPY